MNYYTANKLLFFLPPQTKIIHVAILGAFTISITTIFKTYSTLAALAPSRGPNLANYEHTISATRRGLCSIFWATAGYYSLIPSSEFPI